MYRTKTCGELNISNVNETVELAGWIQKIRDLGAMVFIDLRDQFGITQIVINEEELQKQAKNPRKMLHLRTSASACCHCFPYYIVSCAFFMGLRRSI